jgi:DNA repair protein RadD
MLAKTLRDDQALAIQNLRNDLMDGEKRIVLQAATGFGKTVVIADIVSRARARDKKIIITVPAISLIDQTIEMLAAQGVREIGVIQANHRLTDPSQPVQLASVQTLTNRWKSFKEGNTDMPRADVVLVDEVHRMFNLYSEWMVHPQWLAIPFIGFSATPWSKGLGADGLYSKLVVGNTIKALIAQGTLVPYRTFAPDTPDLTGVRAQVDTTGVKDFILADIEEVMRPKKLVANIVETWQELAEDRPTVCFCCSRAHADQVAQEFNAQGINAGYMDCETELSDRKDMQRRLRNGDIKVICNVDVIGIGVDIPELSCVIYARPTMSDIRFVQNVGRGLRSCPESGKTDLLILDHSSTTKRLGFIEEIYSYHKGLDDGKPKTTPAQYVLLPKECPQCHYMKPPRCAVCPHCGHEAKHHAEPIAVERGTLKEYKPGDELGTLGLALRKAIPDRAHVFGQLVYYARKMGYNQWWPNMQFKKIYGVMFPQNLDYHGKIERPCPELMTFIFKAKEEFKKERRRVEYQSRKIVR